MANSTLIEAHKIALKYGCADNPNWKPKEEIYENRKDWVFW